MCRARRRALQQRPALAVAYPQIFAPSPWRRLLTLAIIAGALGLMIFAVWQLDFSWSRIWGGIGKLGDFVTHMFPPSYGNEARLVLYLKALGETLAIAFLGTLLAAIFAFPMGFLAASNVVANRLVHILSAPIWYLGRTGYQVVRTRRSGVAKRPARSAVPAE